MMLPTHAIVGLAIATPLAAVEPELSSAALLGAFVGSVLPDMDMYAGHRRTLHYPTGYALLAIPALAAAVLAPASASVAVAFLLTGAALHCRMDRYGGGLELRPWEATSDRAVYDHVKGRWRKPKRVVSYDGSPADLAIAAVVGIPLLVVLEPPFRWLVLGALVVGALYTLLRRRLATLAPVAFGYVPGRLERYVPDRYRPDRYRPDRSVGDARDGVR